MSVRPCSVRVRSNYKKVQVLYHWGSLLFPFLPLLKWSGLLMTLLQNVYKELAIFVGFFHIQCDISDFKLLLLIGTYTFNSLYISCKKRRFRAFHPSCPGRRKKSDKLSELSWTKLNCWLWARPVQNGNQSYTSHPPENYYSYFGPNYSPEVFNCKKHILHSK